MGIQDRDYWRERYKNMDREPSDYNSPPAGRRFRVIDKVRGRASEPVESHSPERLLGLLTIVSILVLVVFISHQARQVRTKELAQQQAAQQSMQAAIDRAAEAKARADAHAELQSRLQAERLEQKKRLIEKLNRDVGG